MQYKVFFLTMQIVNLKSFFLSLSHFMCVCVGSGVVGMENLCYIFYSFIIIIVTKNSISHSLGKTLTKPDRIFPPGTNLSTKIFSRVCHIVCAMISQILSLYKNKMTDIKFPFPNLSIHTCIYN